MMQQKCMDFPGGSDVKEFACNAGDLGSIPGLGRSPREGNGNPLQYSCLENPMDGGAWQATVHGVAKSRTQLSDFTFFHFPNVQGVMKWSKRLKSLTEKGEFGPHALPISGHWQVCINPRQISTISHMRSPRNRRAGLLTCFAQGVYFIHASTPQSQ